LRRHGLRGAEVFPLYAGEFPHLRADLGNSLESQKIQEKEDDDPGNRQNLGEGERCISRLAGGRDALSRGRGFSIAGIRSKGAGI
jgi:hypothetical protein